MATMKKLSEDVAALRRDLDDLRGAPTTPAANPDAPGAGAPPAAPAPNPRHVPKRDEPPASALSDKDIKMLHEAFEETEDPRVGKILDRVCEDPDCGERGE